MKTTVLFLLAVSHFGISCVDNDRKETADSGTTEITEEKTNGAIISHPMIDNKNQIMGNIPLPANWKLHNEPGEALITGPGGIVVYGIPMRTYIFSNDPMLQQAYVQNGGKLRPYTSIEGIIQQDFIPIAQKEGSKFIKSYNVLEIAANDKSLSDMLYKVAAMDERYEAAVTEWEDKDGNPYAIIIHLNGINLGNMIRWSYNCHGLDAPKATYEDAKNILVNGLSNVLYNPQYFAQYNREQQQNAAKSMAAHHQRMAANELRFKARQESHQAKTDALNSSIMGSYDARNIASDKNQNRFVNYIKDENTVYNPNDNKRYQVQSGSNQTWVNSNGDYVQSNDPNYDPNRSSNNNQQWNQAKDAD